MTMTATQKRERAKIEYDAFLAACPSRQLLDRLSNKWVTLVLAALGSGPECNGETVPASVSYELTDLGLSLHGTMRTLKLWAQAHMDDVVASRAAYDAKR